MENIENDNCEQVILPKKDRYNLPISIIVAGMMIAGALYISDIRSDSQQRQANSSPTATKSTIPVLQNTVLPTAGADLPVTWGDLGTQLVDSGTIDAESFRAIYEQRGNFPIEYKKLLSGQNTESLKITAENAGFLLNLFWGLGLANKNDILETGEMKNPAYNGAGNFASTGGFTITEGKPMDHYSKHQFLTLTAEQQALVEKISQNIFRPCCNNSTHFPDCNHGMAMLGLLELMASQGVTEADMWKTALTVNSFWFPDTYLTIATYMQNQGIAWKDVEPEEILGASYSGAKGYAKIAATVTKPQTAGNGGGCAV